MIDAQRYELDLFELLLYDYPLRIFDICTILFRVWVSGYRRKIKHQQ